MAVNGWFRKQYLRMVSAGLVRYTYDGPTLSSYVVENTTNLTTFYGVTIAAGLLSGRVAEITVDGTYLQNGGGGVGFTFQVRLGGVVIFEDSTVNFGSSATPHTFGLNARMYLANGVVTAPRITGQLWIAGSPATTGDGNFGDITTVLDWRFGGLGASDMSASQLLEFRIAHAAASQSINLTRLHARTDIVSATV